ncbi:MAG: hypothetical protein WCA07_10795 [Gloeobacterales cyanobacterium]
MTQEMPAADYQPPVSQLLSYGKPKNSSGTQWFDYVKAYGFTNEHIPDLIRLACEEDLDWQDEAECYAPIHSYRALGQLKAEEAIRPLIRVLDKDDSDWYMDDLPEVFGMIGSACIPALTDYLNHGERSSFSKMAAARGLTKVAEFYPAHRDEIVHILTEVLSHHQQHPPELNGSLVARLLDLEATESVSVIERAYKEGPMDEMICGSWARVQIELGLATASDFSPEELRHKEPEWIKSIRKKLADRFPELTLFDDTPGLPTNKKAVTNESRLELFGKSGLAAKKSKSAQPKSGFGSHLPKEKKRKRKR